MSRNALLVKDDYFDNLTPLLDRLIDVHGRPYEPTPIQAEILSANDRFQVWLMGRRAGKSTTAAIKAIIELMKPNKRIWIVAPTYQLTEKIYRVVHGYTTRNLKDMLASAPRNNRTEMSIKFITGSELVCKSADDPNSLVGDSLDLVIIDEAAIVKDIAIDYLLPALNDINPSTGEAKGKLIAVSTPREHNWFKDMYDRGVSSAAEQYDLYGKTLYKSFIASSFSNPHTDHDAIYAERKRMPENLWRQEFLAEFQSEGGIVFEIRRDHFFMPGFRSVKQGQTTYIGIDFGKAHDYTVMVALNGRYEQIGYRRVNKTDWPEINAMVKDFIEDFAATGPVVGCLDESGVGSPIFDDLSNYFEFEHHVQLHPINFTRSNIIKNNIVEDLRLAIGDGLIKFWDVEEIYEEFKNYMYKEKDGKISYSAPPKKHDDIVTATGLALYATKKFPPSIVIARG